MLEQYNIEQTPLYQKARSFLISQGYEIRNSLAHQEAAYDYAGWLNAQRPELRVFLVTAQPFVAFFVYEENRTEEMKLIVDALGNL